MLRQDAVDEALLSQESLRCTATQLLVIIQVRPGRFPRIAQPLCAGGFVTACSGHSVALPAQTTRSTFGCCRSGGNPKRIAWRYANKAIGRYVVRRMHLRLNRTAGCTINGARFWSQFGPFSAHVSAQRCTEAEPKIPQYSCGLGQVLARWCSVVQNPSGGTHNPWVRSFIPPRYDIPNR
jgi:hypothetical protein